MTPNESEKQQFAMDIESVVVQLKCTYLDAVIHYCENKGLEIEAAAQLINNNLKSKLHFDAKSENLIKDRHSQLPI